MAVAGADLQGRLGGLYPPNAQKEKDENKREKR